MENVVDADPVGLVGGIDPEESPVGPWNEPHVEAFGHFEHAVPLGVVRRHHRRTLASSAPVSRKFATASRSMRRIGEAMLIIRPKSMVRRMRAADIFVSASRDGVRGFTWS